MTSIKGVAHKSRLFHFYLCQCVFDYCCLVKLMVKSNMPLACPLTNVNCLYEFKIPTAKTSYFSKYRKITRKFVKILHTWEFSFQIWEDKSKLCCHTKMNFTPRSANYHFISPFISSKSTASSVWRFWAE